MRRKDREVTEMEEIQQIFDECKVCRIGIMDENGPYIVPVNYGYVREEGKVILYIHGAREGKKIDLIRKNANVGVEIDYRHELMEGDTACQYSYYYASIIGKGAASIIDNPREKLKALNVIMKHQTGREACGQDEETQVRLYDESGKFIAIYQWKEKKYHIVKMFFNE